MFVLKKNVDAMIDAAVMASSTALINQHEIDTANLRAERGTLEQRVTELEAQIAEAAAAHQQELEAWIPDAQKWRHRIKQGRDYRSGKQTKTAEPVTTAKGKAKKAAK